MAKIYDAVVVGSGPNGLAAAITMARAGHSVLVMEWAGAAGGGMKTEALTLPGFIHDTFSAVHPMAAASSFFESLPLHAHGLEWITPYSQAAHPFADGSAVTLEATIDATAAQLGRDADSYRYLMEPLVREWHNLFYETFQPMMHVPQHPLLLARFGSKAIWPASLFAKLQFSEEKARALFLGIAAHANMPLNKLGTAAIGLMLMLAGHARGWPFPKGGSGQLAAALVSYLKSQGGEITLGEEIKSAAQIPASRFVFFDLSPRQIVSILGDKLPPRYRHRLAEFKYGPGVFKMDFALSGPIPWRSELCRRTATVHLGGSSREVVRSEQLPTYGKCSDDPYVLLTQPSLFDSTRAPVGKHTAWAYCHIPHASTLDRSEVIENQIERFAPGFRDLILRKHVMYPKDLELRNANLIGGDISGGAVNLGQLISRPLFTLTPYELPVPGYYLCSASTPPGSGVHGMGGMNAAHAAIAKLTKKGSA